MHNNVYTRAMCACFIPAPADLVGVFFLLSRFYCSLKVKMLSVSSFHFFVSVFFKLPVSFLLL